MFVDALRNFLSLKPLYSREERGKATDIERFYVEPLTYRTDNRPKRRTG